MNNKTIIEFGFRIIEELWRSRRVLSASAHGLDGSLVSRIDLVSKNLLANCSRNCPTRNNREKLCQKITYTYRKNRKNNKSKKNQDLEREKRAPKCSQISQKWQKKQGFFLRTKNTRDKYRKNHINTQ